MKANLVAIIFTLIGGLIYVLSNKELKLRTQGEILKAKIVWKIIYFLGLIEIIIFGLIICVNW